MKIWNVANPPAEANCEPRHHIIMPPKKSKSNKSKSSKEDEQREASFQAVVSANAIIIFSALQLLQRFLSEFGCFSILFFHASCFITKRAIREYSAILNELCMRLHKYSSKAYSLIREDPCCLDVVLLVLIL